ncbi:uncharacterized protein LOC131696264 [Topomyia yanbarensis]|uniref:uncharacterized protein LOC131696264 n=1 Tax=Topomyia yanbarensis TaxID=2498891 RepID=UPI00273AEC83|nr:uncharacterized protein LOC131696264 [Topomyia yanbarensis]
MGLKVFLGGLKDPLGPIIRAQTPTTIREALRLCLEENNYNHGRNCPKTPVFPPALPPRPSANLQRIPMRPPPGFLQPPTFQFRPPQIFSQYHPPQNAQQYRPSPPIQQFRPPPPFRQGQPPQFRQPQYNQQFPKPVPMEVDPSIRSRQINNMNRSHPTRANHGPHYQLQVDNEPYEYFYDEYNIPDPQAQYEMPNSYQQPENSLPADEYAGQTSQTQNDYTNNNEEGDDLNFLMAQGHHPMT